jgi:hypothetical protein
MSDIAFIGSPCFMVNCGGVFVYVYMKYGRRKGVAGEFK